MTFVVTNDTGSPRGWGERVVETARGEVDRAGDDLVAVAGHTHEVVDTTVDSNERDTAGGRAASGDGIRVLNPGSATGASPADRATMLVATVEDGSLEVEQRTR